MRIVFTFEVSNDNFRFLLVLVTAVRRFDASFRRELKSRSFNSSISIVKEYFGGSQLPNYICTIMDSEKFLVVRVLTPHRMSSALLKAQVIHQIVTDRSVQCSFIRFYKAQRRFRVRIEKNQEILPCSLVYSGAWHCQHDDFHWWLHKRFKTRLPHMHFRQWIENHLDKLVVSI